MAGQPVTHIQDPHGSRTKILAISGSVKRRSSNSALVHAAAAHDNPGIEVHIFEHLADLPHFNPDLDGDSPPAPVVGLRALARDADAMLIASPEYAHEMPGSLKNALDWLVSSGELYGKPAALLCASPSRDRGEYAREALQHTRSGGCARSAVRHCGRHAAKRRQLSTGPGGRGSGAACATGIARGSTTRGLAQ